VWGQKNDPKKEEITHEEVRGFVRGRKGGEEKKKEKEKRIERGREGPRG